jgi:ketosteroid isomerase-like protein
MSRQNVELVRLLLEGTADGIARGDLGAAFDLGVDAGVLAPDAELLPARELDAGVYRGREGFVDFMRIWTEDFEKWEFEVERVMDAAPDCVVAVLRQRGLGKASGAPVELTHGAVYEFDDGRINRVRLFLDPADALRAAGTGGQ